MWKEVLKDGQPKGMRVCDVHAQSRIVLLNLLRVHEASRLLVPNVQAHLMLHERDETLICPECGDEFALQVMDNLN